MNHNVSIIHRVIGRMLVAIIEVNSAGVFVAIGSFVGCASHLALATNRLDYGRLVDSCDGIVYKQCELKFQCCKRRASIVPVFV